MNEIPIFDESDYAVDCISQDDVKIDKSDEIEHSFKSASNSDLFEINNQLIINNEIDQDPKITNNTECQD